MVRRALRQLLACLLLTCALLIGAADLGLAAAWRTPRWQSDHRGEWRHLLEHVAALAAQPRTDQGHTLCRSMQELVQPYGYPLEAHTVETTDGYLLGVFRMPHGVDADAPVTHRPPVLLQHGLLESSAVFVDNGPRLSLAFALADAGFDVWMANTRGNMFSRAHVALSPGEPAFWDFSWDEMAAGDLPAATSYILAATGHPKMGYVGHSQGTTVALAAFADNPALAAHFTVAALLAPVAFLQHLQSPPVKALAALDTDTVFDDLGLMELLPGDPETAALFSAICKREPDRCVEIIDMICGANPANLNATRLPLYLQYTPAGTSVRNMVHWAQGVRLTKPTFQKYDWGGWCWGPWLSPRACNWRMYGRAIPPKYDLRRITTPIALFSGGMDKMAMPPDVAALTRALRPKTLMLHHVEPDYQHLDYTWGLDAHVRIYPTVIKVLRDAAVSHAAAGSGSSGGNDSNPTLAAMT